VTYYSQTAASTPSGLPTSVSGSANATLSVSFNNSFSSVTNYLVNYTATGTSTITTNAYSFSNSIVGGQYTIVIQLVASGAGTTTWVFNGPSSTGPPSLKSNFTTITTGAFGSGTTRYVVLTIAFDGTNYLVSGSTFA
jgi:hypothetical protein